MYTEIDQFLEKQLYVQVQIQSKSLTYTFHLKKVHIVIPKLLVLATFYLFISIYQYIFAIKTQHVAFV